MTFAKGQSGNPGGRRKDDMVKVKVGKKFVQKSFSELCREMSAELLPNMKLLIESDDTPAPVKLDAWRYLNDRGFGKIPNPDIGDGSSAGVQIIIQSDNANL